MSPTQYPVPVPQPDRSGLKTALAAGAIVALIASNVYLFMQVSQIHTEQAKMRETILTELTNLKEASTVTTASQRHHLDTLKQELESTRHQANAAASQAKSEALARTEQVARRLEEEQKQQAQKVTSEIGEVKQAATTANAKIADVSGDVTNVKSQVQSTKSELDKTISDLKRVTGDLGVQSGLVATNGKELAALKRLGERNYFEFNLGKTKAPQRVGDITLQLKKTDPKHNKYTVEVMADDKKFEKKDRTVNEPIQFYSSKARQPYEIVVNQVTKDQIVGYLATPKDQVARN